MENKNLKVISPVDGSLIGEIKFSEEKEYLKKMRIILYEERKNIAELITREQGNPYLKPLLLKFCLQLIQSITCWIVGRRY